MTDLEEYYNCQLPVVLDLI